MMMKTDDLLLYLPPTIVMELTDTLHTCLSSDALTMLMTQASFDPSNTH